MNHALWPQRYVNSLTQAMLVLLGHLSSVFETRDYVQSQVYVYILICRLSIRAFQDVKLMGINCLFCFQSKFFFCIVLKVCLCNDFV